jgi:hypothetical protein
MKTVYYILASDLKKVARACSFAIVTDVCNEYYYLIDDLPRGIDAGIIYWIEGNKAKHSSNFKTNFDDYKYKKLELVDLISKIKTNENRLQKQKTDVVRGDDTEGNRVQSRKCKAAVTVGYLSYKAVKV